jgi:hypothetical protein
VANDCYWRCKVIFEKRKKREKDRKRRIFMSTLGVSWKVEKKMV